MLLGRRDLPEETASKGSSGVLEAKVETRRRASTDGSDTKTNSNWGVKEHGSSTQEGHSQEGHAEEGAAQEGYSQEGYSQEGHAEEGAAQEGHSQEGPAEEGHS